MLADHSPPKYFYGDKMNQSENLDKTANSVLTQVEDVYFSEPNLSRIASPASSLASNKKLEWDSGADIGYNISDTMKHSRKCKSFPTLSIDIKSIDHIAEFEILHKDIKLHSTPNESKMQNKVYTKINEIISDEKVVYSSMSSGDKVKDKSLQTTLNRNCSKEIQTDPYIPVYNKDKFLNKSLQTDNIALSAVQSISSTGNSSKSGSFRYIPGSNIVSSSEDDVISNKSNVSSGSSNVISRKNVCYKHGPLFSSTDNSHNKSESSSSVNSHKEIEDIEKQISLDKIISKQQSNCLINDIEQSLNILQQFINSKNYSTGTKKHYVKKIITKILKNKYTDDTCTPFSSSDEQSNKEPEKKSSINKLKSVSATQENKLPEIISVAESIKLEESNTLVQQNLDNINILSENTDPVKDPVVVDIDIDIHSKNWKDEKTLSEKIFESRKKSALVITGSEHSQNKTSCLKRNDINKHDYLIQHSKLERKRQVAWIKNEMIYLRKLKTLLQTKQSNSIVNTSSSIESLKSKSNQSNKINPIDSENFQEIESRFNLEFGINTISLKPPKTSVDVCTNTVNQLSNHSTKESGIQTELSKYAPISSDLCINKVNKLSNHLTKESGIQTDPSKYAPISSDLCINKVNKLSNHLTKDSEIQTDPSKYAPISSDLCINKVNKLSNHLTKESGIQTDPSKYAPMSSDLCINKVNKLSNYLSTEQIKHLIHHDTERIPISRCDFCLSSKSGNKTSSSRKKFNHSNCSLEGSYNSHKYSVKENIRPLSCIPHKNKHEEDIVKEIETLNKNENINTVDIGTQYTLTDKETNNISSNTENLEYSNKNYSPSNDTINNSTKIEYCKSDTISSKIYSLTSDKTNLTSKGEKSTMFDRNECSSATKIHKTKPYMAYYLTFAEESQHDSDTINGDETKQKLENVVIKVRKRNIKTRKTSNKKTQINPADLFLKDTSAEDSQHEPESINVGAINHKLQNVAIKVPKWNLNAHKTSSKKTQKNVTELSLMDYLKKNRPDFIRAAEWRRYQFRNAGSHKKRRNIFTCEQIKAITNKQYKNLPEVQNKIKNTKIQNERRHYRCMANVFSKKLQKILLNGQISLGTCVNVMSMY